MAFKVYILIYNIINTFIHEWKLINNYDLYLISSIKLIKQNETMIFNLIIEYSI